MMDLRVSARGHFEPAEHIQDCRLAAARWSEDADQFVLLDIERDVIQHIQPTPAAGLE
jgi:hypothetical protein